VARDFITQRKRNLLSGKKPTVKKRTKRKRKNITQKKIERKENHTKITTLYWRAAQVRVQNVL
jgi:hypothetical protein